MLPIHVTVYLDLLGMAHLSVTRGAIGVGLYALVGEAALIATAEHGAGALADRLDECPDELPGVCPRLVAVIAADLRAQYHRAVELSPPLTA